ncbi:MerR family transcriptional regulator [Sphingomonas melonis TY]|jgi:DNA-binding transcriptional MerR regulator|uniref:MerR family transcriptional regulator n=1 Tax=Sphingomonas melonis TY TaxID=621456 RepID=A0A175XZ32_9SPHN|nr:MULTISPECIES: MerR family transcriptional regulator [Sphingomonas]AOW22873.1 MerR family transcriptional regulator [Sphingomonas melonis TY]ATI56271.1 MerR family transcriptional regulator [Sphingomonas melonis]KZB93722.1 MerR family transcriptional regulator [Sphingomonas melonis TY]MBI0529773.1 MerR family transcriptional regulator [Sphingomonas sp. TX0522]MBX8845915.1 MerR family transcriptional regulator [Sphingomonas melonis]
MVSRTDKARGAFRTIGEVSAETGLAHHILRYWETRFPQLRPVTRAGNRRYYRPEDVALVRRIDTLLNRQGYTIRGVQQLLADADRAPPPAPADEQADLTAMLLAIRNRIADALRQDDELKPR